MNLERMPDSNDAYEQIHVACVLFIFFNSFIFLYFDLFNSIASYGVSLATSFYSFRKQALSICHLFFRY